MVDLYIVVSCPSVVKDYNASMIGVDKHDQLRPVYRTGCDRESVKWWQVLQVLRYCSCKLLCDIQINNQSKDPLLGFKRDVAKGVLTLGKKDFLRLLSDITLNTLFHQM